MAMKKVSSKPQLPQAKAVTRKATPKKTGTPRSSAVSISSKAAALRAAEVEANLGGSRPLTEFLSEIDWYE